MKTIRIISRKSLLAQIQANIVAEKIREAFPNIALEFLTKETSGDIDLSTPLHQMPDPGVFTNDIREELLKNKADLAVHSWKDLPVELQEGTEIVTTLTREDPRDLLIFKKNSVEKKIINIFTSSPRRKENLANFLPEFLSWKPTKINFIDIRGNIQTRISKLFDSKEDGLVIALAAMKRLLSSPQFIEEEPHLLNFLKKSKWMILPLSENPAAPAQGALAVEIASDNHELKSLIKKIGDETTFDLVMKEREILKKYGGGCHQKIGVTIINSKKGEILNLKGETEEGDKISKSSFIPVPTFKNELNSIESFFPSNASSSQIFDRVPLTDVDENVSKIKDSGIFVSRGNVLENIKTISKTNVIWTSGVETWKKLATQGIWVNGTSDSMGENENPPIALIDKVKWFKLSHSDAREDKLKLLPTYQLVPKKLPKDIEKNSHYFWMSSSSFKLVLKKFPSIENANHACGMGKTFDEINLLIPGKVYPYQNYQDWLDKIRRAK